MEPEREIRNELSLFHAVIEILLEKGYPAISILRGWRQENRIYDLAIVDPKTSELLAVFEMILHSPVVVTTVHLREKIEKYKELQAKAGVPLYIVSAMQGKNGFSIRQFIPLAGEHEAFLPVDDFPPYKELKGKTLGEKLASIQNKFGMLCWFLAFIAFVLLVLDWTNKLSLSPERLALIGVIFALILLPFLRKIKILGIEIERLLD